MVLKKVSGKEVSEYKVRMVLTGGNSGKEIVGVCYWTKEQAETALGILTQPTPKLKESIVVLSRILKDLQDKKQLQADHVILVDMKDANTGFYMRKPVGLYHRQVRLMIKLMETKSPVKLESFRNCLKRVASGTADPQKPLFPFLPVDGIFEKA